jgi:hypothetical protein
MSNTKKSGSVSGMESPALAKIQAQLTEIESKRIKFDQLSRKINQLNRLTSDLEVLTSSTIHGHSDSEGAAEGTTISKIHLNFEGDRYQSNAYVIENTVIMREVVDHLITRFTQKRGDLENEILTFTL